MEPKNTLKCQSNLEKEKVGGIIIQVILQSCSNQNNMGLAQKETHRSMEQNRKSRNKTTIIWSINLQQTREDYPMEKRQSLQ